METINTLQPNTTCSSSAWTQQPPDDDDQAIRTDLTALPLTGPSLVSNDSSGHSANEEEEDTNQQDTNEDSTSSTSLLLEGYEADGDDDDKEDDDEDTTSVKDCVVLHCCRMAAEQRRRKRRLSHDHQQQKQKQQQQQNMKRLWSNFQGVVHLLTANQFDNVDFPLQTNKKDAVPSLSTDKLTSAARNSDTASTCTTVHSNTGKKSKRIKLSRTVSKSSTIQRHTDNNEQHKMQLQWDNLLLLDQAISFSTRPHVLFQAQSPHCVVHANAAYHALFGDEGVATFPTTATTDSANPRSLSQVISDAFGWSSSPCTRVKVHPVWGVGAAHQHREQTNQNHDHLDEDHLGDDNDHRHHCVAFYLACKGEEEEPLPSTTTRTKDTFTGIHNEATTTNYMATFRLPGYDDESESSSSEPEEEGISAIG